MHPSMCGSLGYLRRRSEASEPNPSWIATKSRPIGTDRGLIRFDGFNFRPVSFASIATASNVPILQLLTDAGGKLWVRPQAADLVRQKDGKFESVRYGPVAITALSKDNHDG